MPTRFFGTQMDFFFVNADGRLQESHVTGFMQRKGGNNQISPLWQRVCSIPARASNPCSNPGEVLPKNDRTAPSLQSSAFLPALRGLPLFFSESLR